MKSFFTLSLGILIALASCTSTKLTSAEAKAEAKAESDKMDREKVILSEGYSKAKVINKGGDCGFILEIITGGNLLKPVSWTEPEVYQKDGNVVWVKYRESRSLQNGCLEAKPVVIDEIKLIP